MKKGDRVLVRTHSAGVFVGEMVSRKGREVVLKNARRIWYWAGAATLSELAMRGTSQPSKCRFPMPAASILLTEAIEIIPMTAVAVKSLDAVPVWTA